MFFFLHFMHVDPSKSCTLGLWTWSVDKRGPSDRSASLFRLYVSQTTCMWTWNPPFVDVLSTAPLISDLSGQRRVPETSQDAVRFLSGGALLPVLRCQLLNSLVHAAPPHPTPPSTHLRFQHPHPQNAAHRTSSRFVYRIASSSCAGCQHQEVLLRPRCSVSPSHS